MVQKPPIRLMLVDDHRRVHEAVMTVLRVAEHIHLVGQCSNGEEAVNLVAELRPDVILMDVLMPVMDGVAATHRIREAHPDVKILALSSFQDEESVHAMLSKGANGYVLKSQIADDLVKTIEVIMAGKAVFSPEVAQQLLNPGKAERPTYGLTEREHEVLRLMAEGLNNAEIAAKLTISRSTVKFHLTNVLLKLGVETRAEAIVLAAKNGLI